MADRKTAPQDTVESQPYNTGLDARDITFDRLAVVGNQAKHAVARRANPGDLAIGESAEDVDATFIEKPNALRFYILDIHANYACGFDGPQGQWEEGDPSMPPDARRQYNLTLFAPEYSADLPVIYTASASAAGIVRKGLNKRYALASISGDPIELAFEMTTDFRPHTKGPYPVPVFKLAKPVSSEVEAAKRIRDMVIGSVNDKQITAGADSESPGF